MDARDKSPSRQFALCYEEARETLRKHMAEHGLLEENGWWIYEFTRHLEGRTELVMRPMHRQLTALHDLECVVVIDEPGSNITSECHDQDGLRIT